MIELLKIYLCKYQLVDKFDASYNIHEVVSVRIL